MIVLVSLIALLRGFPCFHDFSHGPSHPYIHIHSFLHLFHIFLHGLHINSAARMRTMYISTCVDKRCAVITC